MRTSRGVMVSIIQQQRHWPHVLPLLRWRSCWTNPATSSSSRAFRTSALLIDLRALPLQPALHAELLDEPLEAAAKILSEVSLIISLQLLCFLEEEEKHSLKHTHTITDYWESNLQWKFYWHGRFVEIIFAVVTRRDNGRVLFTPRVCVCVTWRHPVQQERPQKCFAVSPSVDRCCRCDRVTAVQDAIKKLYR